MSHLLKLSLMNYWFACLIARDVGLWDVRSLVRLKEIVLTSLSMSVGSFLTHHVQTFPLLLPPSSFLSLSSSLIPSLCSIPLFLLPPLPFPSVLPPLLSSLSPSFFLSLWRGEEGNSIKKSYFWASLIGLTVSWVLTTWLCSMKTLLKHDRLLVVCPVSLDVCWALCEQHYTVARWLVGFLSPASFFLFPKGLPFSYSCVFHINWSSKNIRMRKN